MIKKVDVIGFTKPSPYPKSQGMIDTFGKNKGSFPLMLGIFFEKEVKSAAQSFAPDNIVTELKIPHFNKQANRKSNFFADAYLNFNGRKIVFEYDGWHHYTDVFKMDRDQRKKNALLEQGFEVITFPYYLQLTKDLAKYYFERDFGVYSEHKYRQILEKIYKTDQEKNILAPGWHTTKNTPANFIPKGIDKLLSEVSSMPLSTKSQLVHSLNLYIERSNGREDLIVPEGDEAFDRFMAHKINKEDVDYFFCSDV